MKFFLDTNICIYALKNNFPQIRKKMESLAPSDIAIPSLVKAELYYGAFKSQNKQTVISVLDEFLAPFEIIPFSDGEIMAYAKIRASLEKKGTIIGPNDLLIAAIALSHNATLVTHNTREFKRVESLKIQDWTV